MSRLGLCLMMANLLSFVAQADPADPLGLKPKKLVLAIGISTFQDPIWQDLRFAHKDAGDMYQMLRHEADFDGGELLQAKPGSKGLHKRDLIKAFSRLQASNLNEDDTVVMYVSSHGTLLRRPEGVRRYIVTSSADSKNLHDTALSYDWLIDQFHQLRSRKKVLILAFCYSGHGKSALTPRMKRELAQMKGFYSQPLQQVSEGSIILTASGWQEPALEAPDLQNDVYTHFLLKGVSQDTNGDGAVSITEAHQFASQATYVYTKGRQRPSATTELLGSDPVILKGKVERKAPAMLYAYLGDSTRLQVDVDGKRMGAISKGLQMPEGRVKLTITDPDSGQVLVERAVDFEPGREYPLERFLNPTFPNTLALGLGQWSVLNNDQKEGYAPDDRMTYQLNYTLDEAIGIFDATLALSIAAPGRERIETASGRFTQTRQMAALTPRLRLRKKLAFLSTGDRSLVTELHSFAGPSVLWYDRRLDEEAFEQKDAQHLALGATWGMGLEALVPYNLIKFGVTFELGAYRNFTDTRHLAITTAQVAGTLGTFW